MLERIEWFSEPVEAWLVESVGRVQRVAVLGQVAHALYAIPYAESTGNTEKDILQLSENLGTAILIPKIITASMALCYDWSEARVMVDKMLSTCITRLGALRDALIRDSATFDLTELPDKWEPSVPGDSGALVDLRMFI